ncbi:MAG: Mrp/NBP35 family ATP-binding protein [Deltaproteobacteria bacterium]
MAASSEEIFAALKQIPFPGFSRDIVSFGVVRGVKLEGGETIVTLAPPSGTPGLVEKIAPEIDKIVASFADAAPLRIVVEESTPDPAQARQQPAGEKDGKDAHEGHSHAKPAPRGPQAIPGVARIIAIASGKGGVGKSTVAVNLALALKEYGRVGLMDTDIYGPSAPILLGAEDAKAKVTQDKRIVPVEVQGIRMVSMALFVERERPIIWRGPMLTKLVAEFIGNTEWGDLDFLVLDLPPGTGDVQLTLSQTLKMDGGVIVTTPQDVALADVRRGVRMFKQMNVPVLGVIENMAGLVCRHCGEETNIFGRGGGERIAEELKLPFLGELPLVPAVAEQGDAGVPIVVALPDEPVAMRFREIAAGLAEN